MPKQQKPEGEPDKGSRVARARTGAAPVSIQQAPETAVTVPQAAIAIMEALARRFTPEDLCDRLQAGLEAMSPPVRNKVGDIFIEPDYRTRLRYIEVIMAYIVGRPVERQQVLRGNIDDGPKDIGEVIASMATSKSAIETIRRLLDGAEENLSKKHNENGGK